MLPVAQEQALPKAGRQCGVAPEGTIHRLQVSLLEPVGDEAAETARLQVGVPGRAGDGDDLLSDRDPVGQVLGRPQGDMDRVEHGGERLRSTGRSGVRDGGTREAHPLGMVFLEVEHAGKVRAEFRAQAAVADTFAEDRLERAPKLGVAAPARHGGRPRKHGLSRESPIPSATGELQRRREVVACDLEVACPKVRSAAGKEHRGSLHLFHTLRPAGVEGIECHARAGRRDLVRVAVHRSRGSRHRRPARQRWVAHRQGRVTMVRDVREGRLASRPLEHRRDSKVQGCPPAGRRDLHQGVADDRVGEAVLAGST